MNNSQKHNWLRIGGEDMKNNRRLSNCSLATTQQSIV